MLYFVLTNIVISRINRLKKILLIFFLQTAFGANSSRPGTVPVVPSRCTVRGRAYMLHIHSAAALGGRPSRLDFHRWSTRLTRIL